MRKKKSVEEEINEFLEVFNKRDLSNLLTDILPLFELYNVDDENDWVRDAVGKEDSKNIRLIRTVYLLSWFIDMNVGKLCSVKAQFKDLWKRMEKDGAANG